MPVLSLLKDNRKILQYMAGATFLLSAALPHLFSYVGLKWNSSLQMLTVGGYLLFVLLGYLLATEELSRKKRIAIYALGLVGAALRYAATWLLSTKDGAINKTFFGYTAYFSVFLAMAVFVFFKHLPLMKWLESRPKLVAVIQEISGCSFGIYLVHMLVIRMVRRVIPNTGWEWRLLVPFLIYAIALLLVYVLKKIPLVRRIVP